MPEVDEIDNSVPSPEDRQRAERFWTRAKEVAERAQYDYAIEMYLAALEHDPNNVAIHQELRKVALTRKGPGKGKALGSMAAMKLKRSTKDEKANFLNARKLLAYDPGNAQYLELVARTAAQMGLRDTVVWVGPMLYRTLLEQPKQNPESFIALKEIFKQVDEFQFAIDALAQAAALRPDESDWQHELRELSTLKTIRDANYDKGGSFTNSIRNADQQRELMEKDADIHTASAVQNRLTKAREEYELDKSVSGKLQNLVDMLVRTRDLKYENEALELLEEAYERDSNYRWKFTSEEIQIRQFARGERMLMQMADTDAPDPASTKELEHFRREKLEMELKHFQNAGKAYPTEMRFKYEAGRRLFDLEQYTDAIPLLQQSQNDSKIRDDARLVLGRAFLAADYVDEAVDTLRNVIESYKVDADDKSKDMHYWYGRSLEEKGDTDDALKAYSQIAQWDFGYRDVQSRIKSLRAARK